LGGTGGISGLDYVWDALRVGGTNNGERIEIRIRLESAGAS
jgi:hypothetical protein